MKPGDLVVHSDNRQRPNSWSSVHQTIYKGHRRTCMRPSTFSHEIRGKSAMIIAWIPVQSEENPKNFPMLVVTSDGLVTWTWSESWKLM